MYGTVLDVLIRWTLAAGGRCFRVRVEARRRGRQLWREAGRARVVRHRHPSAIPAAHAQPMGSPHCELVLWLLPYQ